MGTENKNQDPEEPFVDPRTLSADELMGMVPLSEALRQAYDEITWQAGQNELSQRIGAEGQPKLAVIEEESARLRMQQAIHPSPEAEQRLAELKEKYDELMRRRAQEL